jgi:hypothetical protein
VLAALGALAGFIGTVLFDASFPNGSDAWTRDIFPGANVVAVFVVVTVGMVITRNAVVSASAGQQAS